MSFSPRALLSAAALSYHDHKLGPMLNGLWLAVFAALAALYVGETPLLKTAGLSPLLLAMLVGVFYGNTLRVHMPGDWAVGLRFAIRQLLRLAIVLFGLRVTFGDLATLGVPGVVFAGAAVVTTLAIGYFVGTRWLKLDAETSLMCAAGASICGAAAVLATEGVCKGGHAKTAVAVATVVIFGTLAMLWYPVFAHFSGLDARQLGLLIGATTHEVAQVAAAGALLGDDVAKAAIVAKMARVFMLAPVLLVVGYFWSRAHAWQDADGRAHKAKAPVPWFAFGFIAMAGVNSLHLLPAAVTQALTQLDVLLLATAMAALGVETTWERMRSVGAKPFVLGGVMFAWLLGAGYLYARFVL